MTTTTGAVYNVEYTDRIGGGWVVFPQFSTPGVGQIRVTMRTPDAHVVADAHRCTLGLFCAVTDEGDPWPHWHTVITAAASTGRQAVTVGVAEGAIYESQMHTAALTAFKAILTPADEDATA